MQERWELVAYVNSTVIDDVAQPLARESSVSGALNDTYGLGRLSTVGGTEAVPVTDTYLEDGFGSVSAVMAGDGRIAASYAYAEGNPVASADPTCPPQRTVTSNSRPPRSGRPSSRRLARARSRS